MSLGTPGALDRLDERLRELGVDLDEDDFEDDFDDGLDPGWEPARPPGPSGGPFLEAQVLLDGGHVALSQVPERAGGRLDDLDPFDGLDPAVDLPAPLAPPGYVLDRRGVLRYAHDRSCVPGQQRVTLDRLWRFERRDDVVLVPEMWVRTRTELWWCDRWGPYDSTTIAGVAVAAHPVPAGVWDRYASWPIAVTAPELEVSRMLDAAAVAGLAGLARSAVPTYLARGVLPEPQARVANSPLWSAPPLGVWLATRREPGRPSRKRRRART